MDCMAGCDDGWHAEGMKECVKEGRERGREGWLVEGLGQSIRFRRMILLPPCVCY